MLGLKLEYFFGPLSVQSTQEMEMERVSTVKKALQEIAKQVGGRREGGRQGEREGEREGGREIHVNLLNTGHTSGRGGGEKGD